MLLVLGELLKNKIKNLILENNLLYTYLIFFVPLELNLTRQK